jgi:hypothetical protein
MYLENVIGKKPSLRQVFITVLRIRDVYPGSRILIFTHPGSRIQKQQQKRGEKN